MRKLFVCLAVALLAAGCNSEDGGGGSPTDPSQVNIEFSTTDLVTGTGAGPAVPGNTATVELRIVALQRCRHGKQGHAESKARADPNPQVPGTTIGPITLIVGTGQYRRDAKSSHYLVSSKESAGCTWAASAASISRQTSHMVRREAERPIPPNASIVFEVELTNIQ